MKESMVLNLLKTLLNNCPDLKRVFIADNSSWRICDVLSDLEAILFDFVSKLENLDVFCLVGFPVHADVEENFSRRVTTEVIPKRPAFWFHFGNSAPKVNDPNIPRMVSNSLVHITDRYLVPPKF